MRARLFLAGLLGLAVVVTVFWPFKDEKGELTILPANMAWSG
jgi:hypothetical protein